MFRLPQSYNPVQTICLAQAMKGPIAFQATAMVIGAAHLSVLQGFRGCDMDLRSIQQKVRALQMLNDGIRAITEETCLDILFGILSLANVEVRCPTFLHQYADLYCDLYTSPLYLEEGQSESFVLLDIEDSPT
jgi:hypothetical protein